MSELTIGACIVMQTNEIQTMLMCNAQTYTHYWSVDWHIYQLKFWSSTTHAWALTCINTTCKHPVSSQWAQTEMFKGLCMQVCWVNIFPWEEVKHAQLIESFRHSRIHILQALNLVDLISGIAFVCGDIWGNWFCLSMPHVKETLPTCKRVLKFIGMHMTNLSCVWLLSKYNI